LTGAPVNFLLSGGPCGDRFLPRCPGKACREWQLLPARELVRRRGLDRVKNGIRQTFQGIRGTLQGRQAAGTAVATPEATALAVPLRPAASRLQPRSPEKWCYRSTPTSGRWSPCRT